MEGQGFETSAAMKQRVAGDGLAGGFYAERTEEEGERGSVSRSRKLRKSGIAYGTANRLRKLGESSTYRAQLVRKTRKRGGGERLADLKPGGCGLFTRKSSRGEFLSTEKRKRS